jgi:hypothetical protein
VAEHDQLLDVHCPFDMLELGRTSDPTQTIAEVTRIAAEEMCATRRLRLRHPDPREVIAVQALDPLTGAAVLLVSTRWITDPA